MRRDRTASRALFMFIVFRGKQMWEKGGGLDCKELLGSQCFPSACDACYTVLEDQALHTESISHREGGGLELLP